MKTNVITTRYVVIGCVCLMLMLACGIVGSPTANPTVPPTTIPEPTKTHVPTPTLVSAAIESTQPQEVDLVFRDNFEGEMDEAWQWTRENKSAWSLSKEPGWLEIITGAEMWVTAA